MRSVIFSCCQGQDLALGSRGARSLSPAARALHSSMEMLELRYFCTGSPQDLGRRPAENPLHTESPTPSLPVFPHFSPRASLPALFVLCIKIPGSARQWIPTFPSIAMYLCPISATLPARRKETAPTHQPPRPREVVQHGPWLHNASHLARVLLS